MIANGLSKKLKIAQPAGSQSATRGQKIAEGRRFQILAKITNNPTNITHPITL
jgi:hypothetical protein